MIKSKLFFGFLVLNLHYATFSVAQSPNNLWKGEFYGTTTIDGQEVKILIIDGDTLPVVDLERIQVSQKRSFKNRDEHKRYRQWRKYAAKVYPYAAEAIRLFRQLQVFSLFLSRRCINSPSSSTSPILSVSASPFSAILFLVPVKPLFAPAPIAFALGTL